MNDKTDLKTTHTTGNMHVTRSETNYVNVISVKENIIVKEQNLHILKKHFWI